MITRMLQRLGLFLGAQRDYHDESEFFLHLNQWLLRQSGGSWDHPEPLDTLMGRQEVRDLYVDYMRHMVQTRGRVQFLGWQNALRGQAMLSLSRAWGWKDPRNTFTLPLWLEIFPDAKIVHIVRHGVDVARSLQKRERQQLETSMARHEQRKWLYWFYPKKNGFLDSPRCLSVREGIELWHTYVKRANTHIERLDCPSYTLRYESFLAEPTSSLRRLANFCGLAPDPSAIKACGANVDPSRRFAYRHEPSMTVPEESYALLEQHGYSN